MTISTLFNCNRSKLFSKLSKTPLNVKSKLFPKRPTLVEI